MRGTSEKHSRQWGANLLVNLYIHNQIGGSADFNIYAPSLDFSNTSQKELGLTGMAYGQKRAVQLFNKSNITANGLAFGQVYMTYRGNNQFSIDRDYFDFDYQPKSSRIRNIATLIGGALLGQYYNIPITPFSISRNIIGFGGPFSIYFYGTVTIPPK